MTIKINITTDTHDVAKIAQRYLDVSLNLMGIWPKHLKMLPPFSKGCIDNIKQITSMRSDGHKVWAGKCAVIEGVGMSEYIKAADKKYSLAHHNLYQELKPSIPDETYLRFCQKIVCQLFGYCWTISKQEK